jgi:hypothetical protein
VPENAWLWISFAATFVGLGWLALAMDTHWQQARGPGIPCASTRRLLRVLGAMALTLSLWACFLADHPTMAPLVWIMGLAVSAASIAMILAWRPRLLAVLWPRALG